METTINKNSPQKDLELSRLDFVEKEKLDENADMVKAAGVINHILDLLNHEIPSGVVSLLSDLNMLATDDDILIDQIDDIVANIINVFADGGQIVPPPICDESDVIIAKFINSNAQKLISLLYKEMPILQIQDAKLAIKNMAQIRSSIQNSPE